MPSRSLFPTLIHHEPLKARGGERLRKDLHAECLQLRDFDAAGRRWSESNYPGGYTSYSSMSELHRFSSTFEALARELQRHAKAFAKDLHLDMRGRTLELTDCWVNIMAPGVVHSLHLHPLSVISGTYYVAMPDGAPGLKFEDPRLDRFMAAPPRRKDAPEPMQPHVVVRAAPGDVLLFESWLRHEVPANRAGDERISISFNFA